MTPPFHSIADARQERGIAAVWRATSKLEWFAMLALVIGIAVVAPVFAAMWP